MAHTAISVSMLLKWGGFVVAMVGMVCWLAALFHLAPQQSVLMTMWLGNFQRRQAFTEKGWRLRTWSVRLGLIGFILAGLGILAF
jgi:hypothetical protein